MKNRKLQNINFLAVSKCKFCQVLSNSSTFSIMKGQYIFLRLRNRMNLGALWRIDIPLER